MFFPERLNIEKNDSVLEIWPGGYPYYRSDVLFDRFYDSEEALRQSGWTWIRTLGKPLVVSDADRLPFKDDAFDYIICSHVLEHVPSGEIEGFVSEMLRLAPRGYVEFPSIFYESFFDIPEHKNILFLKDQTLYVIDKNEFGSFWDRFSPLYRTMRNLLWKDSFIGRWILVNKRLFFIGSEYDRRLGVKLMQRGEMLPEDLYPQRSLSILKDIFNLLKFLALNKFFRKKSKLDNDTLCCPSCQRGMEIRANAIKCIACGYECNIYL